jgi:hypothetical protein
MVNDARIDNRLLAFEMRRRQLHRQPMALHGGYAASEVSSKLKGSTKQFGWLQAATTDASEKTSNQDDADACPFLNAALTCTFPAVAQSAEAWMNTGSEALLIGNALKKSGQLLALARRQRCAE